VVFPAGGRDDEALNTSIESGLDVCPNRIASGGIEDEVSGLEGERFMSAAGRPAQDPGFTASIADRGRNGPAQPTVAEDYRVHLVSLASPRDRRFVEVRWRESKSRGHRSVFRGPWSLRSRRPHSVVDYARRQSPRARASRQGRQSFFFDSVVKMRRT
jgi:hypothetical protein